MQRFCWLVTVLLVGGCGFIERPAELDCAKVPLHIPDWLVRSCVLSVSCSPFVPDRTIGECIRDVEPLSTPYHACMKDATTCSDIAACRAYWQMSADACVGAASGWRCEGDIAIQCGVGRSWAVDCGQLGAKCTLYKGADQSSFWPCALSTTSCSGADSWHCDGSRRTICSGTTAWGHDCAAMHAKCIDAKGGAFCSTAASTCSTPGTTCQGHDVQQCHSAGVSATYRCAVAGGSCDNGDCVQTGCSFGGQICEEGCADPTQMRVCLSSVDDIFGSPLLIDCTKHGFSSCALVQRKENSPFAACR